MTSERKPAEESSEDVLLRKLKTVMVNMADAETVTEMAAVRSESVRMALDSRGDPFGRHDILVLESSEGPRIEIPVNSLPATVGAGEAADHKLAGQWISRIHCEIVRNGAMVRIRDAGSKNGTLLNGQRVDAEDLRVGDSIQIGLICLEVGRA